MQFKQLFALGLIAIPSIALPDNTQDHIQDHNQFFLIASVGSSQIDINDEPVSNSDSSNTEQTTLQFGLGFQFDNQLNIELSRVNHSDTLFSFTADEHYKVYERRLSLGYRIPLENFRITPKLGYSAYDFKVIDGHFLGFPETKRSMSDTGFVVSLALEYEFNRHFGTQLEWSRLDGEFGKLDATTLGLRFAF